MNDDTSRTLESAFTCALARAATVTIDVPVMDRSTSMEHLGDAPEVALNAHRMGLATATTADHIVMAVFGFSDALVPEVILPLTPVRQAPPINLRHPVGNTRLYGTVLDILKGLAKVCDDLEAQGVKQKVLLTVFTDGNDNQSADKQDELKREARKARKRGWELCVNALGLDAQQIARNMGFNDDPVYARSMPADRNSLITAMHETTERTVTTSLGGNWRQQYSQPVQPPPRSRPITMPVNEDTPPPSSPR